MTERITQAQLKANPDLRQRGYNSLRAVAESRIASAEKRKAAPEARKAGKDKGKPRRVGVKGILKPPTEHQEQSELFRWAENESARLPALRMLFAIPNGAGVNHQHNRNGKRFSLEGAKLKREGMKQGVPDVFLAVPSEYGQNGFGLFIEMKRAKRSLSKISPEQLSWHSALSAMGYRVEVCYGWEAARNAILNYLEGK